MINGITYWRSLNLIFGKLSFAVTPFLNNSIGIGRSNLSGIMLNRPYRAFDLHFQKTSLPLDKGEAPRVSRISPSTSSAIPFSLNKLSYIEETGTVIYRSKMSHGGRKRNFEVLILSPDYDDRCNVFAAKGLDELGPMPAVGFSVEIIAKGCLENG